MSTTVIGQAYAIGSGFLAAIASLCGKYAIAPGEAQDLCESIEEFLNEQSIELLGSSLNCEKYGIIIRLSFFIMMILVNCVMWTTFTKALRFSHTSLEATITNTAANFFFTAIIGQVIFGEIVTGLWWMGSVLIICGLLLMHHSRNPPTRKPGTRMKKFQ